MSKHEFSPVAGQQLIDALLDQEILHKGDTVRRVVIDIRADGPVMMHVERYGDERLLGVAQTLDGVEISEVQNVRPPEPEAPR